MDNLDTNFVAYCGLYCGTCWKFKKGKCPGCRENINAKWCKTRDCCIEKEISTCAECEVEPTDCKKLNNGFSKFYEIFFNADRFASIEFIKENGEQAYEQLMVDHHKMVMPKRGKQKFFTKQPK